MATGTLNKILAISLDISNIERLRSWRLVIEYAQGNLDTLQLHLAAGLPIIIPLDTDLLPYWLTRSDLTEAEQITDHAVVVVGLDEQFVYVNDPDFEIAPQIVERGWFYDAWLNHENWHAVIRQRWPWRLRRP